LKASVDEEDQIGEVLHSTGRAVAVAANQGVQLLGEVLVQIDGQDLDGWEVGE